MIFLPALFFGFFLLLAGLNFRLAMKVFLCILPSYLLRFKFGPLPSTYLELSFGAIALVWLIRYGAGDLSRLYHEARRHYRFCIFLLMFFAGSTISIFISDMWWFSLGQWRAYFLEPMVLFTILVGRREFFTTKDILLPLGFSTLVITLFGIFQGFSGFTLPSDGRVTSIYTSPNAVGLYLAPIFLLLLILLKDNRNKWERLYISCILFLSALTIMLTLSLGTMVGLGAALVLALIILNKRSLAITFVTAGLVLALALPSTRTYLLSKERSSGNRITLWTYSFEYLTASPKNFVFGTGVRQFFRKIQKPEYDPKQMERLIYPHNIFLNFWTETGLLGLFGFTGIFAYLSYFSWKLRTQNKLLSAAFLASLAAIFVHGLVDVPYFKNDLAMMFWIISALITNEHLRSI